ncbi:hypothetical protein ADM99_06940 [Leptolinea tardivitalis]|uniref:O-antigen ligase-related domain-containing protein n=2 Tax=Leptolinea tardivitalis TaxID=229920 RepID=A0A0P6XLS5_9CHLR|nr:hypothetical protein ADM99_06940 [Leptolinea tardivitalis]GAP20844.1 lipid A core - O-antigen ligase [Leptolinea tardivitalis]
MRVTGRTYSGIINFLWAALLILLPITSMPSIRDLLHINVISGPSVLILALLMAAWFLPYFCKNGNLPREMLPLIGFVLVSLIATTVAQFLDVPSYKDADMIRTSVTAFITLLVGIGYFVLAYSRVSTSDQLRNTLIWIYLGGLVMIIWSVMQSGMWFINGRYPDWMRDFQDVFSLGPLYRQRAAGFALEPSWLAHMLNMLYLPMWLAASFSGYSVFSWRLFKKISIEMVLLAMGVLTLILTLSRVGWITFFCMVAFLVVHWNILLVQWIQHRFKIPRNRRIISAISITCLLVIIYLSFFILAAYIMSRVDPRMSDLFTQGFWQLNDINRYANALQFGERVVYWQAGWEVFSHYPILGVGLGNAGRWFTETIPAYGMNLIEVRNLLYRSGDLPNIKNLWVRLLAETGLIGFAFYCSWLSSFLIKVKSFRHSTYPHEKMAGYWGIFIIIGIIFEGFSIDSFAMPYFWISAGLVLSIVNFPGSHTLTVSEDGNNDE